VGGQRREEKSHFASVDVGRGYGGRPSGARGAVASMTGQGGDGAHKR
jgi:hypothetical protein